MEAGARVQRPLWASTGTKNPAYSDVMYIEALIGPDTVNTVPKDTLVAFKDHGKVAPTLEQDLDGAQATLDKLAAVGISLDQVTAQILDEGIKSFSESYHKLVEGIEGKRKALVAEAHK